VAGRYVDLVRSQLPGRAIADELEPLLAERVARAAAAHPGIAVDPARFLAMIAERLDGELPASEALSAMRTDDLYLACGCAAGDPAALAGFERQLGTVIERAVAATGASPDERADLGQIVRQRLLVAAAGEPPRIASFSARGPLAAWVRVVAVREAARMLPRARREVAADDDELAGRLAADDDPEVGYLKRLYRTEFKRAFQTAVEELDDRDRLVLRQHVLDGLGIDQLAALHGVHRATTARWIQTARDAVLAGTQRALSRRLGLSRGEIASVMRLIASQLDVSLPRLLAPRERKRAASG